jgi:hypothetical protein
MADQIGVQIVAADQQFIASTKATAAAMAAVVAQEERLGKAAKDAGLDQKKFSATYKQLEKQRITQEGKASKDAALEQKKKQKASTAQKTKETKDAKAAATLRAKEQKDLAASDKESLAVAKDLVTTFVGVGVAVGAAAVALGIFAIKTKETRDNTKSMLDVLTNGRGDKTLTLLDGLAGQLGQKFQDVRDNFVEFRKAGLGNKQSTALLKLVADLKTVDKSGSLAQQAIDRVLSYASNGPQTKDQVAAQSKVMALLAKQAHVAGDGTLSAAAAATTLSGALNRIDNTKTKVLESLGDKIQPSIDKASSAIATFVEKLAASKEGQKTLNDVAEVIGKVADAIGELAKADPDSTINQIRFAFAATKDAGLEVVAVFKDVALAAWEIPKAFWIVGNNIVDAVSYVGKSLYNLPGNIKQFVIDPIAKMGPDIVDGLVSGVENGAARLVKSVSGLAGKAKAAFKDALGIHSPSKVFAGYGVNIGAGLNKGLDRSMPDGGDMAQRMLPAPENIARAQSVFQMPAPIFGPMQAAQSSSSERPHITINVRSASDDDIQRLRRELDMWWLGKQQQQGLA